MRTRALWQKFAVLAAVAFVVVPRVAQAAPAVISRFKAGGSGYDDILTEDWRPGWSHFVTFGVRAAVSATYLLSYMESTGEVAIDRIRPDGTGYTNVYSSHWTFGWSHFVPLYLASGVHLLSYKEATGQVAIDRIRSDGTGYDNVYSSQWTTGWSNFLPFSDGGSAYLFSYKKGTGEVQIDRIQGDGTGYTNVFQDHLATIWTHFVTLPLSGSSNAYFLSYAKP
jgi:hypothetical protein